MEKINKEEFLEELIYEYGKLVYSICFRITKNHYDSEDLAQDTFLSAYKNLHQFDGKNSKAWISKIATNKCLDYMKHGARKQIVTEDNFFIDMLSQVVDPADAYLEKEVSSRVEYLCNNLKPPYNEIAYEHICNGKTAKELSKHLGIPLKTVQTQIYRSKKMLKDDIGKESI